MAKKKSKIDTILTKSYVEPKPITKDFIDLKISRLKPNMVMSGTLTKVKIRGQDIQIKFEEDKIDSWICLINMLLGVVYESNQGNFLPTLIKYGLICDQFQVTSVKPVYLEGSKEIEERLVYSIVHKKFYMILKDNKLKWIYLVTLIQTLFRIVEGEEKNITLDIRK